MAETMSLAGGLGGDSSSMMSSGMMSPVAPQAAIGALQFTANLFDYYENKKRQKEEAAKEERRYQDYLTENKRRYDLEEVTRKEQEKTNRMLLNAGLNQNIINRKDAIEGQNYSRYNELKKGLENMINTSSYKNKFLSTWGA